MGTSSEALKKSRAERFGASLDSPATVIGTPERESTSNDAAMDVDGARS